MAAYQLTIVASVGIAELACAHTVGKLHELQSAINDI